MIRISLKKDDNGNVVAFKCEGHAGYAKSGRDIICAAVSVLTVNTINSIEQLTEDAFECESNEDRAYIYFSLKDSPSAEAALLLKSFELGIEGIISDNGNKYIRLIDWEV